MQESPLSVIIIVLSHHLCWLHAGITVICDNHRFIRSPNSKVGSFEIAKIKIAKIISHTFIIESRKFSSAKISRYTVYCSCRSSCFNLQLECICLNILTGRAPLHKGKSEDSPTKTWQEFTSGFDALVALASSELDKNRELKRRHEKEQQLNLQKRNQSLSSHSNHGKNSENLKSSTNNKSKATGPKTPPGSPPRESRSRRTPPRGSNNRQKYSSESQRNKRSYRRRSYSSSRSRSRSSSSGSSSSSRSSSSRSSYSSRSRSSSTSSSSSSRERSPPRKTQSRSVPNPTPPSSVSVSKPVQPAIKSPAKSPGYISYGVNSNLAPVHSVATTYSASNKLVGSPKGTGAYRAMNSASDIGGKDKLVTNNQINSGNASSVQNSAVQAQMPHSSAISTSSLSSNVVLLQFTPPNSGLSQLIRTSSAAAVSNPIPSQGQIAHNQLLQGHSQLISRNTSLLQTNALPQNVQSIPPSQATNFQLHSNLTQTVSNTPSFNFPDFSRPPPNLTNSTTPLTVHNDIPPPPLPPLQTTQVTSRPPMRARNPRSNTSTTRSPLRPRSNINHMQGSYSDRPITPLNSANYIRPLMNYSEHQQSLLGQPRVSQNMMNSFQRSPVSLQPVPPVGMDVGADNSQRFQAFTLPFQMVPAANQTRVQYGTQMNPGMLNFGTL